MFLYVLFRLKEDGLNVSLWMQSLSSFCGNLYKKYPGIELVGLLQYITNTLKSAQIIYIYTYIYIYF